MNRPNFGNWINLLAADQNFSTMDLIRKRLPGMRGFLFHYDWALLEQDGRYDLSHICDDLDWCAERGLMAVPMVKDKNFQAGLLSPIPADLQEFSLPNKAGGVSTVRWAPKVRDRFGRLLERLARFQTHPAFEGIMLTESAPSLTTEQLAATGYTPEIYEALYLDWISRMDCRVFWQANFVPPRDEARVMRDVMAKVDRERVFLGGPDVLPLNQALLERTYPTWALFETNFATMSVPSYSVEGYTVADVAAFARDVLNVRWLFWTYRDAFDQQAAVINAD